MNYSFISSDLFLHEVKRLAKRYKSLKQDLERLKQDLLANPHLGVDLGDGVRKVRMAIASKNKGKSGGARVLTYTYEFDEENGVINLLFIYDKSEMDNVNNDFIDALVESVTAELPPDISG